MGFKFFYNRNKFILWYQYPYVTIQVNLEIQNLLIRKKYINYEVLSPKIIFPIFLRNVVNIFYYEKDN